MPDHDLKKLIEGAVTEAIKPLEAQLAKATKLRNWALLTAMLCLVAAILSVAFAKSARDELHTSQRRLRNEVATNRAFGCSSARSTALGYRVRQVAASGAKEGKRHFEDRLVAQRETLRHAAHLRCPSLRGFESFTLLRVRALIQIERLLAHLAPQRFQTKPQPLALSPQKASSTAAAAGGGTAQTPARAPPTASPVGSGGGSNGHTEPQPHHPHQHPHAGGESPAPGAAPAPVHEEAAAAAPTPTQTTPTPTESSGGETSTTGSSGLGEAAEGVVERAEQIVCSVNRLGLRICVPKG